MSKDGWLGATIVLFIAILVMLIPRGVVLAAATTAKDPVYQYKPDCRQPKEIDASNCIYYRQALAAEDSVSEARVVRPWVIAAGIGALLAAIAGAYGGVGAMRAARATEAAIKSQRAWMTAKLPTIEGVLRYRGEDPCDVAAIKLDWINSGGTPALEFIAVTELGFGTSIAALPSAHIGNQLDLITVGIGEQFTTDPENPIPRSDWDAFFAGRVQIWAACRCRYKDVFDPEAVRNTFVAWQIEYVEPRWSGGIHNLPLAGKLTIRARAVGHHEVN